MLEESVPAKMSKGSLDDLCRAMHSLTRAVDADGQDPGEAVLLSKGVLYQFHLESMHHKQLPKGYGKLALEGETEEQLAPYREMIRRSMLRLIREVRGGGKLVWAWSLEFLAEKRFLVHEDKDVLLPAIEEYRDWALSSRGPGGGRSERVKWLLWSVEAWLGDAEAEAALLKEYERVLASQEAFTASRVQGATLVRRVAFAGTDACVIALLRSMEEDLHYRDTSIAGFILPSLCRTFPDLEKDIFSPSYEEWFETKGIRPIMYVGAATPTPESYAKHWKRVTEKATKHFRDSAALKALGRWARENYGVEVWTDRTPDVWLEIQMLRVTM
jgi:hypothetical protein